MLSLRDTRRAVSAETCCTTWVRDDSLVNCVAGSGAGRWALVPRTDALLAEWCPWFALDRTIALSSGMRREVQ
jgi:hypothetical protein